MITKSTTLLPRDPPCFLGSAAGAFPPGPFNRAGLAPRFAAPRAAFALPDPLLLFVEAESFSLDTAALSLSRLSAAFFSAASALASSPSPEPSASARSSSSEEVAIGPGNVLDSGFIANGERSRRMRSVTITTKLDNRAPGA